MFFAPSSGCKTTSGGCGITKNACAAKNWRRRRTRSRSAAIKLALMDNHLVVGVGNIYANESLFRAGIRPTTRAGKLSRPRLARAAAWRAVRRKQVVAVA